MKTIGIKLADGSFYPVLEEGSAQTKKLELTTANNNQTKVMVDLYRSSTCSMDDAEYVDSLQIENLIEHPNGEAVISFTVSLDDENQLDAQIIDEETGNSSSAEKIQLISRTIEERLVTDEFGISESQEPEFTETEVSEEDIENAQEGLSPEEDSDSNNGAVAAAAVGGIAAGAGLMAMANAIQKKQQEEESVNNEEIEAEPAEEPVVEETAQDEGLASFNPEEENFTSEDIFSASDEDIFDDIETDDTNAEDITQEDIFAETESPADDDSEPMVTETLANDDEGDDDEITSDDLNFDDLTLPGDPFGDSTSSDETVEDSFSDDVFADNTEDTDSTIVEDVFADTIAADDTITDDTAADDIFGDDTMTDDTFKNDVFEEDFGIDDVFADTSSTDDIFADEANNFTASDADNLFNDDDDIAPAAGGISFTGLYDKETEMGTSSFDDEEDTKKKTKAPVIICLICAIICILAVILILFVIPSPCNVLKKNVEKESTVVVEPSPAPVVEETEPEEEPVPEAKEDEIIIIEKAEEVVPVQPEPAVKKPENIVYKIKWGDTLWDIAGTYYKNPWKYKYIARYNGIKNPDHIISGTKIIIPAE